MKTRIFILLIIISANCFSQDLENVNGAAVYFKAGVNASNFIKWDDNEPTEMLVGASGGMGVYIRLGKPTRKTLSMAIEANFSGQGFSLEQNDETIKVRTNYFNASVLLRQYFGKFYVTAGGEHGWLLSAKEKINDENEDVPEGIYEKSVWNGIGGIGLNFGDKNTRQVDFGLELTYKQGLSQVRSDFSKARHSVFNLSMFIPVSFVGELAAGMQSY
jgi:Outer membrane protein beta-barrel domain